MKKYVIAVLSILSLGTSTMRCNLLDKQFLKAARAGRLDTIEKLLTLCPSVLDSQDKDKNSALHWAAREGHLDIVIFLLDKGCDVDGENAGETNPLFMAAYNGKSAVVQELLNRGSDPDSINRTKRSCLFWAILNQHIETARVLINNGTSIDPETNSLIKKKFPKYDYEMERYISFQKRATSLLTVINVPCDLAYLIASFEKGAFAKPPSKIKKRHRETAEQYEESPKAKKNRTQKYP